MVESRDQRLCVFACGGGAGGQACVCWLAHKYKEMRDKRQEHRVKDRIKERQERKRGQQRKKPSEAERDRQET